MLKKFIDGKITNEIKECLNIPGSIDTTIKLAEAICMNQGLCVKTGCNKCIFGNINAKQFREYLKVLIE